MPAGILLFVVTVIVVVVMGKTGSGRAVGLATEGFLLYYAGVFALIALTAAVGIGLVSTDRIFMTPASRVTLQAVHRAVSFGALSFLVIHIVFEIAAGRSQPADAVLPFLDEGRTFYLGLGTVASDLFVVIAATGIMRARLATNMSPGSWRILHCSAYAAWLLGIVHGLLAGRPAKSFFGYSGFVAWSYGACVAAVGVALVVRLVATDRSGQTAGQPVPERPAPQWQPPAALAALGVGGFGAPQLQVTSGRPAQRALPAGPSALTSADLPVDVQDQAGDRSHFGYDESPGYFGQDPPGGHFGRDDPRGHFGPGQTVGQFGQADPRQQFGGGDLRGQSGRDDPGGQFGRYGQADPRGQFGQADPREQFGQGDLRSQFDPRELFGQADPRGQYGQADPRELFGQTDPRGLYDQAASRELFGQADPRGQYGQPDPRGQYGQPDLRGQYGQADPRGQYGQPDLRGQYGQADLRGQYGPADPRELFGRDDPRAIFGRDDAPAFEDDYSDHDATGPLPSIPFSRDGTRW